MCHEQSQRLDGPKRPKPQAVTGQANLDIPEILQENSRSGFRERAIRPSLTT